MNESVRTVTQGDLLDEQVQLSLEDLCRQCAVSRQRIVELVDEGVVSVDVTRVEWRFDLAALRRVRTALRLQRDLEINLAGVAVVLDLLDEVKQLRSRLRGDFPA